MHIYTEFKWAYAKTQGLSMVSGLCFGYVFTEYLLQAFYKPRKWIVSHSLFWLAERTIHKFFSSQEVPAILLVDITCFAWLLDQCWKAFTQPNKKPIHYKCFYMFISLIIGWAVSLSLDCIGLWANQVLCYSWILPAKHTEY